MDSSGEKLSGDLISPDDDPPLVGVVKSTVFNRLREHIVTYGKTLNG